VRAAELAEARPELAAAVEPLLKAREAVGRQIADLDRKVRLHSSAKRKYSKKIWTKKGSGADAGPSRGPTHFCVEGRISDEAYYRLEEEIDWAEFDAAPAGRFQPLMT
jgi:hypothetical protein